MDIHSLAEPLIEKFNEENSEVKNRKTNETIPVQLKILKNEDQDLLHQAQTIIVEAFQTSSQYNWCVNCDNIDEITKNQRRDELVSWACEVSTQLALKEGLVLALLQVSDSTNDEANVKNPMNNDNCASKENNKDITNNNFQPVVIGVIYLDFKLGLNPNAVVQFFQKAYRLSSAIYDIAFTVGIPSIYKGDWGKEPEKRFGMLMQMDEERSKVMGSQDHLFVLHVGVLPLKQNGFGIGTKLLKVANMISDVAKVPIFLDTDEEYLIKFYERYGYRTKIRLNHEEGVTCPLTGHVGMVYNGDT